MGKISVRQNDWKLVLTPPPFGTGDWQLFNLKTDLAESDNLFEKHPDTVKALLDHWHAYKKENGVIFT